MITPPPIQANDPICRRDL
jgi:Co/Zn/Cd efflux system component